jgi:prophage regulatory protein
MRSTFSGQVVEAAATPAAPRRLERLLDKWAIEEQTSLDITTIYRKIKDGTFPSPVRVGKRRVAWRESDISRWLSDLTTTGKAASNSAGRQR